MEVKLVAKTIGESEFLGKSIDETLVGIARVSSGKTGDKLFESPKKLLRHCVKHGHWSVFDMATLIFKIETSRAMGRELLRHWSLKPQEFSQRYSSIFTFESIELRKQSTNNRQSSTDLLNDIELDAEIQEHLNAAATLYTKILERGGARECARMILPECTTTTMYFNGTIRSWITTLNQRLHKSAQKEIRLVAEAIRDIFKQECPITSEALFGFKDAFDEHILDKVIIKKYLEL
jgi:thymidylate synthase (FAD)